jgi:hypothetical protein
MMGQRIDFVSVSNAIINDYPKSFWENEVDLLFSEDDYFCLYESELQKFVNQEGVYKEPFKNNVFDCDDYSFVLKARASLYASRNDLPYTICLGIAWGYFNWTDEYHACNWAIALDDRDNPHFFWIEPQKSFPQCKHVPGPKNENRLKLILL